MYYCGKVVTPPGKLPLLPPLSGPEYTHLVYNYIKSLCLQIVPLADKGGKIPKAKPEVLSIIIGEWYLVFQ